jgi:4-diphosphocytidyl-2-C-methyl-D-erythritol kinase
VSERLIAPAKLTSSLRIVGVRADGFHFIDAEFVSLSIHDVITIDPSGDGISITGAFATDVPADRTNLAMRALAFVDRTAHITIEKRIPAGGGLGGGSSDAAAILRWSGFSDSARAAEIGSDVPFCIEGGRARVTGIGERVKALEYEEKTVTLIIPPLVVSTPAVYRTWDRIGGPIGDHGNDLEAAALAVEPALAGWRDKIRDLSGQRPRLAGSGATWFLDGEHSNILAVLRDKGAKVLSAQTVRDSKSRTACDAERID